MSERLNELQPDLKNELENWMRSIDTLSMNFRNNEYMIIGHRRLQEKVDSDLPNLPSKMKLSKRLSNKITRINVNKSLYEKDQ